VSENKGKNTPGVDKVTWNTPRAKTHAIASLKRRGYINALADELE
jgi:RNA-directed DNA polymerase